MSGYYYFPNNLKDIKDHDKLQKLFPINGNSFQRKPKLIATLPLIFYSSIRFVFETVFQNKLRRTGLDPC